MVRDQVVTFGFKGHGYESAHRRSNYPFGRDPFREKTMYTVFSLSKEVERQKKITIGITSGIRQKLICDIHR